MASDMLDGGLADEDCDDMVNLHVLEPGTILRNLESRFGMTKPYTYVGRIVISTNPFQWIDGLYSDETIVAYSRVPDVFADLRPHVYAVARDALDNLTQQQVCRIAPPSRCSASRLVQADCGWVGRRWPCGAVRRVWVVVSLHPLLPPWRFACFGVCPACRTCPSA